MRKQTLEKRLILFGAGRNTEMLLKASNWRGDYEIVGIIDNDINKPVLFTE